MKYKMQLSYTDYLYKLNSIFLGAFIVNLPFAIYLIYSLIAKSNTRFAIYLSSVVLAISVIGFYILNSPNNIKIKDNYIKITTNTICKNIINNQKCINPRYNISDIEKCEIIENCKDCSNGYFLYPKEQIEACNTKIKFKNKKELYLTIKDNKKFNKSLNDLIKGKAVGK